MLRLAAITLVLLFAGAGVARADDCEFEGAYGSLRSPIVTSGGLASVIASDFSDDDEDGLGNPDELQGALYGLPSKGHARQSDLGRPLSPTLLPQGEAVSWQPGRGIVEDGRVLVAHLPFPGYLGVAAAEAPDGTLTLLYGAGGNALLQRFAPDGSAGAPEVVAPAPAPEDKDDADTFAPLLTADADGTVFGVVASDHGGVAIRWPAQGDPQLLPSPQLVRSSEPALVADRHGGAWVRLDRRLLHITGAGLATTGLRDAESVTNPVVTARGDAVLAYTAQGRAHVQRVTLAGVAASPTSLPAGDVQAIAWYRGHPWVLASRGDALYLDGPRDQILVHARAHYTASGGELAIANGRAWAVWDELSDRYDQECDEYPAAAQTLWAGFGVHDRAVISRGLPGAIPIT